MHYTNGINRPPYEADAMFLQVTSGCSHNKCEFCEFYKGCEFHVSPESKIVEDLKELSRYRKDATRVFLQGADPFVLTYERLKRIAELIHEYLLYCQSIGAYARVTNMKNKSVEQLREQYRDGIRTL